MGHNEHWVEDRNMAMLVDLYELTMADAYHRLGMHSQTAFELFVRRLPKQRNFLIAAGLEQALDYLEKFRFDKVSIDYLRSTGTLSDEFLDYLGDHRFAGEVWAVPEGEAVFSNETILRVTGSLLETQIVETFLINCITFQTMVASKAARISIASGDKTFVDFAARRTHAADAAIKAARASFIGGATGTSNVLAGELYGIAIVGTMAHSFVMAFEHELDAFRAFVRSFPDNAILLIDTYDIEEGARRAVVAAREEGVTLRGVRIDSGDMIEGSRSVRKILDEAGMTETLIVASGDLDEHKIATMLSEDAPVDSFGVGTQLGTSADAPTLGGVYKLVAEDGVPKVKLSSEKVTYPSCKQVFRFSENGRYEHDVLGLYNESFEGATPVLEQVMSDGRRINEPLPLPEIAARCRSTLQKLPDELRYLEQQVPYEVNVSPRLTELLATSRSKAGL